MDRLFWVGLAKVWPAWRQALVFVSPDAVLRWQRRRFREYWARLSRLPPGGRPGVNADIAALVRKIAAANPLWGAPRIHGELVKLGIDIAERPVSRLIPKRPSPSPLRPGGRFSPTISPTWSPSTSSQRPPLAFASSASSLCSPTTAGGSSTSTCPSIPSLTGPPSSSWTPSQTTRSRLICSATETSLRAAISAPRAGYWDQGGAHGAAQPVAEPFCGALDRFDSARVSESRSRLGERHLRHILTCYFGHYHHARTHLARAKDAASSLHWDGRL